MQTVARVVSAMSVAMWLLAAHFACAAPPPDVSVEIDHLLAYVERSECVFFRNGDAHDPADAADHIRRKYEHFQKKIDTTDEFISRSATGSLMSGKPYQVQCPPDNATQPTAAWLRAELERYRSAY